MSIPEFEFKGTPLSEENMKTMMGFMMNKNAEKPLADDEDLNKEFPTQMIIKRIKGYDLDFTITNFFLVTSLITFADSPGKLMIMLWCAFKHWKSTGKELLGVDEWCHIFPNGAPTDEECHTFWDSQKSDDNPHGNMLDNANFWV